MVDISRTAQPDPSTRRAGLSRATFARLAGVPESVVAEWERGSSLPPDVGRRVREAEQFRRRLAGLVRPETIPAWLETPNDAFEGRSPLEVIEQGEIDRLWDMIFYLESGVAS